MLDRNYADNFPTKHLIKDTVFIAEAKSTGLNLSSIEGGKILKWLLIESLGG